MAKYRKRADRAMITVPGVGAIMDDRILEGERFARFCPGLLEKVSEGGPTVPPASPLPPPPRVPEEAAAGVDEPIMDSGEGAYAPDDADDSGDAEAVDYTEWSYGDLRDEVKRRDLKPEGRTKVDLAEALAEDDEGQ